MTTISHVANDRAVLDLSHHNADVDFKQIEKAGVLGIIHKCTEGETYRDNKYRERRAEAQAEGLMWGAYHFLRPGDMAEQAAWFVGNAGNVELLAADHEDPGVSLADLKVFLREVYAITGKRCVIYSGHVIKEQVGTKADPELAQHRLWLAQYTNGEPSWPKQIWPEWWLWQWTEKGKCPGVDGYVDCDAYDGPTVVLYQEWGTAANTPVA